MYKIYLLSFFCVIASLKTYSQFDKKLTFDFSVGNLQPIGEELRADRQPHLFTNFQQGYSFNIRSQYNLNPRISVGLGFEGARFLDWQDPRVGGLDNESSFLNVVNVAPFFRLKLIKTKLSPYLITGVGVGVYNGERSSTGVLIKDFYTATPEDSYASIDEVQLREPRVIIYNTANFYFLLGFGLEYQLSNTLGSFIQAGYSHINSSSNDVLRQDINYTSLQIGVNLNLAKSKTI